MPDAHAPSPLLLYRTTVLPEWTDATGVLTAYHHARLFDLVTDELFDRVGLDAASRERHRCSAFVLESRLKIFAPVRAGDDLEFTTQGLDCGPKLLHFVHLVHRAGEAEPLAAMEFLYLHVDTERRRSAEMRPELHARVAALVEAHRGLPRPEVGERPVAVGG